MTFFGGRVERHVERQRNREMLETEREGERRGREREGERKGKGEEEKRLTAGGQKLATSCHSEKSWSLIWFPDLYQFTDPEPN